MCLFSRSRKFHLRISLALWCLASVNLQAGGDEDANTLLDRVIKANQPWLAPSPIHGSYSLLRQPAGADAAERIGPCNMTNQGKASSYLNSPASQYADRVGSLVWTPLHQIYRKTSPYTPSLAGNTNWNGIPVIAVDVVFDPSILGQIGFGGQANSSYTYSEATYWVELTRLLIEPTQAIPLYIETHGDPTNAVQHDVTWKFDPSFFAIDGGFAPRAFEWNDPDFIRERQEFQLFEKEWVFKQGQAWWGDNRPKTGLIQNFELTDLQLLFPSLTLQRSTPGLVLSWPTYGRTGIVLESAEAPRGPWSSVQVQTASDNTNPVISVSATQRSQFYRLRK